MNNNNHSVIVKDLTKKFGAFVAVDRISFSVKEGEIFGFLGPNGSGKSTTIRMLCGILEPSGGGGTVAGFDIRRDSEKIKANIGYMSQKFSLYPDLTAEENLDFYLGVYGTPPREIEGRIKNSLRLAGLEEKRDALAALLTGGWRQRLALSCAIAHSPKIIFLDEPTSGVDPISRRDFWRIIADLSKRGMTVFVTTHYLEEAEYCHRLALIYDSRIIAEGTPSQLKRSFEGNIFRLLTADLNRAYSLLKGRASISEVSIWGESLHIAVRDKSLTQDQLKEIISNAGVPIAGLEQISPSLEDFFVSKVAEERKGEAGG